MNVTFSSVDRKFALFECEVIIINQHLHYTEIAYLSYSNIQLEMRFGLCFKKKCK